jgi:hypothetical protein
MQSCGKKFIRSCRPTAMLSARAASQQGDATGAMYVLLQKQIFPTLFHGNSFRWQGQYGLSSRRQRTHAHCRACEC